MNSRDMEIIVDNFAGGGGASTGIEIAIGRTVDIAINGLLTPGINSGYFQISKEGE